MVEKKNRVNYYFKKTIHLQKEQKNMSINRKKFLFYNLFVAPQLPENVSFFYRILF